MFLFDKKIKPKNISFLSVMFLIVVFFVFQSSRIEAATGINKQINYQAKLADGTGSPITDGKYDIVFKLYTVSSGGTAVWTGNYTAANSNPVDVSNGVFNVLLGSGSDNSLDSIDFSEDEYYLGITVNADSEMTPRKRIGSTPQAINANNLIGDGMIRITGNPSGSNIDQGTVYVNPQSAGSNDTLLGVAVGGAQKFKIDAAGNLVQSGNLTVSGSGTSSFSGNVGIGTTNPLSKLSINGGLHVGGDSDAGDDNILADGTITASNLSGNNTGDNSPNSLYAGLVTNATHTGDATGANALTVVGINGTQLSSLATGILKNTSGTGVPSIAVAADFPILNQSTTGNAATATNLTGLTATIADLNSVTGTLGTNAFNSTAYLPSASFTDSAVTGKLLTGYVSGAGVVSATDTVLQSINKLNGNIAAATHNAVTLGTANGLSLSTQQLSLGLASSGVAGALSGADWNTFNGKQNALTDPVTGMGTSNYLLKFTGTSSVGNSLLFDNGTSIGVGDATPASLFTVGNGDLFQINSSGQIVAGTWQGSTVGVQYGGTGINTASSTGVPIVSSGTWSVSANLGVGQGGTGTGTQFTPGSLVFAGASGVYTQSNASLFWDNTNKKLGIGTASLSASGNLTVDSASISSPAFYWDVTAATFRNQTTEAIGTGGGISLAGNNASSGFTEAQAAGLQARKTNATSGDDTFGVDLWSRGGAINFVQSGSIGATPSMSIAIGGNVGIGTTSPAYKLDIAGTMRVSSQALFTGGTYDALTVQASSNNSVGLRIQNTYSGSHNWNMAVSGGNVAANGSLVFYDDTVGSPRLAIDASGNVGIGTSYPTSKLAIGGSGSSAAQAYIQGSGTTSSTFGLIINESTGATNNFWVRDDGAGYLRASSWTFGSDRRMKENIKPLNYGLETVTKLNPQEFDYINGQKNQLGFIAQDLQPLIPEMVSVQKDGMLGIQTDMLIPILAKAMQEQQIQIVGISDEQALISDDVENLTLKTDKNVSTLEQLQSSIDTQLGVVQESLINLASNSTQYDTRISDLEQSDQDREKRIIDIEKQIGDVDFTVLNDKVDSLLTLLNLTDGDVAIGGRFTANITETGMLIIKNVEDKKTDTIGTSAICPAMMEKDDKGKCSDQTDEDGDGADDGTQHPISDGKSIKIKTKAIGEGARVFVTPKNVTNNVLAVTKIIPGEGFTVEIKDETDKDIDFDWWIVGVDSSKQ